MFQNPGVPAQDQTNEQEKQKTNSHSFKNKQIESVIADGIYCQTYKHDQQIQQKELYFKSNDLSKWSCKFISVTISQKNDQEKVIYCNEDSNKAKNTRAEILKED